MPRASRCAHPPASRRRPTAATSSREIVSRAHVALSSCPSPQQVKTVKKPNAKPITKFKIRCTKVRGVTCWAKLTACVAAHQCAAGVGLGWAWWGLVGHAPLTPLPHLQYLYTLTVTDEDKANKLKSSLPPGLPRTDL